MNKESYELTQKEWATRRVACRSTGFTSKVKTRSCPEDLRRINEIEWLT